MKLILYPQNLLHTVHLKTTMIFCDICYTDATVNSAIFRNKGGL